MTVRLALCDDNEAFRHLLRVLLTIEPDLEVVGEAADGSSIIDVVADARPDVLLLDVAMPVLDGIEALPRIVAASPDTRIVMLSGFSSTSVEDQARAAGATAFVEKGTDLKRIVETVRTVAAGTPA